MLLSLNQAFAIKLQSYCSDSSEIIINNIQLSGNKITHDKIIFRELTFKQGDTLCLKNFSNALKLSQENIENTSLFNFVEIIDSTYYVQNKLRANIHIILHERWYIWPMPVVELAERNPNAWWETKDFSKINYALFFTWENFRGRREALKFTIQGGYDEKFLFHYDVPFINKSQTIGLVMGAGLTRNHEVTYQTINNKPVRYRDDAYIRYQYNVYGALSLRKNIHIMHSVGLEYNDHQYSDVIFELNPKFDPEQNNTFKYFSLTYFFKNDHRDNRTFPLKGYYFDAQIIKRGLGIIPEANVNLLSLTANARRYWDLNNRWYFASGFTGRLANTGRNPYFLNTGLGYNNDFVRGYQHYVVDGHNFALFKTDFKYAIFKDKIMNLPILPNKFSRINWSIYFSLFADAAYSSTDLPELSNTLQNKFLYGYGAGLNFVSYYDIVFRLEYSFNKIGENGLFISFITSI